MGRMRTGRAPALLLRPSQASSPQEQPLKRYQVPLMYLGATAYVQCALVACLPLHYTWGLKCFSPWLWGMIQKQLSLSVRPA